MNAALLKSDTPGYRVRRPPSRLRRSRIRVSRGPNTLKPYRFSWPEGGSDASSLGGGGDALVAGLEPDHQRVSGKDATRASRSPLATGRRRHRFRCSTESIRLQGVRRLRHAEACTPTPESIRRWMFDVSSFRFRGSQREVPFHRILHPPPARRHSASRYPTIFIN